MRKNSSRRIITLMIVLSAIGFGLFFGIKGCTEDISPDQAGIILEVNGKKYLYANSPTSIVKKSIEEGNSPAANPTLKIYKDGDQLFVDPLNAKALIYLMSGEYELSDFKEVSYDGYVTMEAGEAFSFENSYRSTKTIGKQKSHNELTLKNKNGEEMQVIWERDPSTSEVTPIRNCQVRGFWTKTHPAPGETVVSSEDRFVVSLGKLANFFGCKYSYNRETKILTVKK